MCIDYRKLNAQTVGDPFPVPFTDSILDTVAGHELYSFLDRFNGYNQIRLALEDQEKTVFVTDWGVCRCSHDVRAENGSRHLSVRYHVDFL